MEMALLCYLLLPLPGIADSEAESRLRQSGRDEQIAIFGTCLKAHERGRLCCLPYDHWIGASSGDAQVSDLHVLAIRTHHFRMLKGLDVV